VTRQLGKWTVGVLFVLFVVWELWAALDNTQTTWPLTWLVITYVPWWVTAVVLAVFCPWLVYHFGVRYWRKHHPPPPPEEPPVLPPPDVPTYRRWPDNPEVR
jgi:hypothetical protein